MPLIERMLIGGEWVESASRQTITVENPGKRVPIGTIPRGNATDVERAVAAAAKAFTSWSQMPPRERGRRLLAIAEAASSRSKPAMRCAPRRGPRPD
jgi:betaine-aldehyde dehydrogenase